MTVQDRVYLEAIYPCIVGLRPDERHAPQPLRVKVELGVDLEVSARSGRLGDTVDYVHVDTVLAFLCREGQFLMLEPLAAAMLGALLSPPAPGERRASIAWAAIDLHKPEVMGSTNAGIAMRRDAGWARGREVLAQVPGSTVLRRQVDTGETLAPTDGQDLRVLLLGSRPKELKLPWTAPSPAVCLWVERGRPG